MQNENNFISNKQKYMKEGLLRIIIIYIYLICDQSYVFFFLSRALHRILAYNNGFLKRMIYNVSSY